MGRVGGARSLGSGSWHWVWGPRLLGLESISGVGGAGDVICGGELWVPEASQGERIGWILAFSWSFRCLGS